MSYWGKFIGGMAGFAMGGPVGALFGAALGHAADEGKLDGFAGGIASSFTSFAGRALPFDPLRMISAFGGRDQVFAISTTVLAAKLCKCDGPVNETEIGMFKRLFEIPEQGLAEVARLFNSARAQAEGFEPYAVQLAQAFSDEKNLLERVLASLYQIAAADGPVNAAEAAFLSRVAALFGLSPAASRRAGQGIPPPQAPSDDPYVILGLTPQAGAEEIRVRWKLLVREHHPDRAVARGASEAAVKYASETLARINAAYDFIRRERGL